MCDPPRSGSICGWVFFHQCRRAQLSRLCLPTTGMDFQGDRTMAGTVTWKLSPRSLKRHIVFFFSPLTHPRCFASTNDLAQWQPCRFQWTVDAVLCLFFFFLVFVFLLGRKREEESVEKLHGGKHKFQCCYCSIVSPTDCIKKLAIASRSEKWSRCKDS